jgi:hypothetical protein
MSTKISFVLFLFLAQFFALCASAQNQNFIDTTQMEMYQKQDLDSVYRSFKNTTIKIRTPRYFLEFSNDQVSGFMNTGTAASIVGFENNDLAYAGYYELIAEQSFSQVDSAKYLGVEKVKTLSGKPAQFFFYSFVVDKVDVIRIMFVTGDDKQMILLQANYPLVFDALLRQVILQSFLTVEFN